MQQPFVLFLWCSLALLHIGCDLVDLDLCHGTTGLVYAAQLGGIALHRGNLQRDGRADDEGPAGLLQHGNIGQRLIVALVPVCHGLHKSGIAHIPCPDKGQHLVFLLYKTLGLGQDDQVALVADRLEKAHRNGIRNTAVQQLIVADLHDFGRQRHGCRSLHPLDILGVAGAALAVDMVELGITAHISLINTKQMVPNRRIENYGSFIVLTSSMHIANARQLFVKRLMDIAGGIVGLALTAIAFVIFAPIIKIQSPGPVFFKQVRIGKNGRRFNFYKFRSMYVDAEERKAELMKDNEMSGNMFKMENDPRIIPIGHFMRKYSIDELPQFWNVLKGDMSLVGTRPPTEDEFLNYEYHHKARLGIKPGLTGMWQVSGRSDITDFEDVVALDTQYISNWSLGLDIMLLFKTIGVVLTGKGSK